MCFSQVKNGGNLYDINNNNNNNDSNNNNNNNDNNKNNNFTCMGLSGDYNSSCK